MKSIKVSDRAYDYLQEHAERNYRTLTGEVDYLVDSFFGEPKNTLSGAPVDSGTAEAVNKSYELRNILNDLRSRKSWLIDEISRADAELAQVLDFDQDDESRLERQKVHKVYTTPLVEELAQVKESIASMLADTSVNGEQGEQLTLFQVEGGTENDTVSGSRASLR